MEDILMDGYDLFVLGPLAILTTYLIIKYFLYLGNNFTLFLSIRYEFIFKILFLLR